MTAGTRRSGADDPDPGDLHPDAPDVAALRRRVLGTGLLTMALFLTSAYVVTALDVSSGWLLLALLVIWVAVVRPLMAPVREALRLRRRLAYAAFLEARAHDAPAHDDPAHDDPARDDLDRRGRP